MALYLSNLHLVKQAAGVAAIVNTMVNSTAEINSLVTSCDVAPAAPILGSVWHQPESSDYIEFVPRPYFR